MNDIIYFAANLGPWRWPLILGLWGIALVLVVWVARRRSQGRPIGGSRGFTLIELSIVLVVIGLITSVGLQTFSGLAASTRLSTTKQRLAAVERSLITYGTQNLCLPCPANGALASTAATAGSSLDIGGSAIATPCATAGFLCWNTDGVVPWKTLGLPEEAVTDAWHNRIGYHVSGSAYPQPPFTFTDCTSPMTPSAVPIQQQHGFTILTSISTAKCPTVGTLTIVLSTDLGGASPSTTGALFVLVSHGEDGSGGRAVSTGSVRIDPNGSAAQALNSGNGTTFVDDGLNSTSGASHYDDIVLWITGANAIAACGLGACGNGS